MFLASVKHVFVSQMLYELTGSVLYLLSRQGCFKASSFPIGRTIQPPPPPPVTHIFPLTHVPFNQQIAVPSSLLNVLSTSHRNIEKYNIKNKKKKKRQKKKRPKKRKIKHQFTKQKIPKSPKNKKSTKNRNTIKRKNIPKNDHQNEKKNASF